MAYPKKSLRFVRFILVLGFPIIWLFAYANIAFQYLSVKNNPDMIGKLADSADSLKLNLSGLFGQSTDATVVYQTLVINVGHVVGIAILSTALLAIAIAVIDMRNMEAVKRQKRREY